MLPEPMLITTTWPIKGDEHLRVKLIERPGINLYTGIEQQAKGSDAWIAVRNSSIGHGDNRENAENRVEALLSGAWRAYFPDNPERPSAEEILDKAYARTFLLNDNGVFTALILEFPGCIAEGDTLDHAHQRLHSAAKSWITAMRANGNPIPEPFEGEGPGQSIGNLQKLWMAVDKWRQDFPLGSPEELSRIVMKIVAPR